MNEGLVLLAPDGSPQLATARAYELFGCATLDALRTRFAQIGELARSVIADSAGGESTSHPIDIEVATADGPRPLRLEVERVSAGPNGTETSSGGAMFAVIVRDRNLLDGGETDLRLATQLRALSRLSAGIAHDMKAPLAAVLLHLELLRGTLDDDRDGQTSRDRRLRYVGVMKDELGRLNRALTSLFTHTVLRPEACETFDLRELLHEIEFVIRPQAQRQGVTLELSPGDGAAMMRGERDAMKHAIVNVAVNALEAMPDGGRLQITLEPKDETVTISIRDSGRGIAADVLPRVFDRHFTTKPGGCGMGLYVTRSVLARHDGTIRTETSAPGACFRLDVPKATGA